MTNFDVQFEAYKRTGALENLLQYSLSFRATFYSNPFKAPINMAAIEDKEREVLVEFRNQISDLKLSEAHQSEHFLIRWLRAREYDLEKAKAMLAAYLDYRSKDDIDNVLSWEPPAEFKEWAPYKVLGFDSQNSPVLFAPFGKWDFRKLAADVEKGIKYVDRIYEELEATMVGKTTPEGLPVTQFVYLIDYGGLSLMQFSSMQVMDWLMLLAKKFEAFHPETVKRFYITNAGRAFSAIFALCKPILGPRTLDRFRFYGSNAEKYKADLLKDLPASILPPKFGGTNTDAEAVASVVVAEEDEDEPIFMAVTVPGGDKFVLNFGVDEGNSTISWAFKTEKHDISFGVTRDGKAYIENKKVDSHVDLQEGTITCDKPGDYIFTFDNTYSRLRSKALSYRVDVKSPAGLKQISFD